MPKPQLEPCLDVGLDERCVLNLGCGYKHHDNAINVDVTQDTNPDILHDLNRVPWPFREHHFREVFAHDVVEHLDNFISIMEEIHRVCQDGAIVSITVPHFSCANAFTDPTHRHYFGRFSFDFVTGEADHSFYTRARFRKRSCQIIFQPTLVNKIVWRIANRFPTEYERRWAWIFPAWYLIFELEVIKKN